MRARRTAFRLPDQHRPLPKTIYQRPMRAFLWRLLNTDYNEVAAGRFWNHVRSREVTLLPSVRFFRQLSIRIVNVNGNFCLIDLRSQPEPIFVSFEQLLPHCFFFSRAKVASPIILTHLEALLHIWFGSLKSEGLRVIYGRENRRLQCQKPQQQGTRPEYYFCEPFHLNSSV